MIRPDIETRQGPDGSIFLDKIPDDLESLKIIDLWNLLRRGSFSGISPENQMAIHGAIEAKRTELLGRTGMALAAEL